MYPFKNFKLNRADIEWLLATHEHGCGPINWSDEQQHEREGLDLRGADLKQVDLRNLPLAGMRGGLTWFPRNSELPEQLDIAAIHLEGVDLRGAHLEGACLRGAFLEKARLSRARIEEADLSRAHMQGAILRDVHLEGATLVRTHLDGAIMSRARLQGANLQGAHLESAVLSESRLGGAFLRSTFFDEATNLEKISLNSRRFGSVSLAGVHWNGVDLSVIDWAQLKMLGEEREAQQPRGRRGEKKDHTQHISEYQLATRSNRQLALVLQEQGLYDVAVYFAYRARVLGRKVKWWEWLTPKRAQEFDTWGIEKQSDVTLQKSRVSALSSTLSKKLRELGIGIFQLTGYALSLIFDIVAGYGYRPERIVFVYLLTISGFATTYWILANYIQGLPLTLLGALVFSMTSFHGRGFFPGGIGLGLDNPITVLAALEAVVGLVIEVSLIASFTQRFFGK
ncbi:MAG TPA: pentapeptide repeat-containing protein, partial [Ktedonobacteraceae bacterium]